MNNVLLHCDGFQIGSLWVPPFTLSRGEIICLIWPLPQNSCEENDLIKILIGAKECPSLHLTGSVSRAVKPVFLRAICGSVLLGRIASFIIPRKYKTSFWRKNFWQYKMIKSQASTLLSPRQIEVIRSDLLGLDSDVPLTALSGKHKELLGVEMAWEDVDVVVFDSFGQDLTYAAVTKKLSEGKAAIQIAYPLIDRLTPEQICHPEARIIEISGWENYAERQGPTRMQVESTLHELLTGQLSREDAAAWAENWIDLPIPIVDHLTWQCLNVLAGAAIKSKDQKYYHPNSTYSEWLERIRKE